MKRMEILQKVAQKKDLDVRQIALSWLLHHSENIILIPGTSKVKHLEENMKIASIDLSAEDMKELDRVIEA
ncbi:MAG: aldo/keto reductase [Prolixibacteraceae bacterium]|nr:aldo/keto reductase [Prolixibacteraceae bacterium]